MVFEMMGRRSRKEEEGSSSNGGEGGGEYEVEDLRDKIQGTRGSRFALITTQLDLDKSGMNRRFSRQNVRKNLSHGSINPETNRSVRTLLMLWHTSQCVCACFFFSPFFFYCYCF